MALAGGNSNRNAMKLKIGQHDRESSKAKCNLQVPCLPFITQQGSREFWESKKCAHAQLFVCHFPSCYTSSVHLCWRSTQASLHSSSGSLRSVDSNNFFSVLHARKFFFLSNITKLVGISCLRVPPCGNILKKIKKLALSVEKVEQRGTFFLGQIIVWKRLRFIKKWSVWITNTALLQTWPI